MTPSTASRAGNVVGIVMIAAFLWLVWGWWSFSGLYRLLAHLELRLFGSFGEISTFAAGAAVIAGLAVAAFQPLIRIQRRAGLIQRRSPAEAKAITERAVARLVLGGGVVLLVVALVAAAVLFRDARRDAVTATLDLSSSTPLPAGAGRVRLIGFTRPELSVDVESRQTPGVQVDSKWYMAVVGPDWRPGMPVPAVVQGSPAFGLRQVTLPGTVSVDTVPFDLSWGYVRSLGSGYAADLLAEHGAIIDSHTLILDTDRNAERYVLWPVVILCGLLAALGIGSVWVLRRSLAAKVG